MKLEAAAKICFVLSIVLISFLYGFVTYHYQWFPFDVLHPAAQDLRQILRRGTEPPHNLHPVVYERSGASIIDETAMAPGVTLITSHWPDLDWAPGIKLIDARGTVLHQWSLQESLRSSLDYVHGTYLFPNGDLVANMEWGSLFRLDACGNVLWRVDEPATHHSIARGDDGNFWVPSVVLIEDQPEARDELAKYPGVSTPLVSDGLLQVSPEGEVLDEIAILDILYANGLQRLIARTGEPSGDVAHTNDVEPLSREMAPEYPLFAQGDLLVSLRNLNLVFVVDPRSKEIKWHLSEPIIQQHDPDFLGDGWIGIFDNNTDFTPRGSVLGGSRILAVQPQTGRQEVRYPLDDSTAFYTERAGKWQQLPNGNMLLVEANAGRVVEVTADGRPVWEWINERYNEALVPEVLEATRYPLTAAEIDAWRCRE